jgi:flavin reductase (DIM6/NTAB) family NADH-FMN oxidoreductase RutF
MVSPDDFKQVMRRWASTVTIVTTRDGDLPTGLTVTSFTSISTAPPTVLVCVNRASHSNDAIRASGTFCVNLLAPEMKEISGRFASRMTPAERFAGLTLYTAATGAPVIEGAIAYLDCRVLDCRVVSAFEEGDHTIFTGLVEASGVPRPDDAPLLYFHGAYRLLGEAI